MRVFSKPITAKNLRQLMFVNGVGYRVQIYGLYTQLIQKYKQIKINQLEVLSKNTTFSFNLSARANTAPCMDLFSR